MKSFLDQYLTGLNFKLFSSFYQQLDKIEKRIIT